MQQAVINATIGISLLAGLTSAAIAQQPDSAAVVQHIDAAVQARVDSIAGYTATEHYAVFRNNDESHPVAEMTVKAVYRKDAGKTYTPIAQSGSEIIRNTLLSSILDRETHMSQPGVREGAYVTSANYEMEWQPNLREDADGRNCLVVNITPRHTAPYLFKGSIWVDAGNYSIVQFHGTATKSASIVTGPAEITRQYALISGFPMAIHARALSNSFLFGPTVIKIDYSDYQIELRPTP